MSTGGSARLAGIDAFDGKRPIGRVDRRFDRVDEPIDQPHVLARRTGRAARAFATAMCFASAARSSAARRCSERLEDRRDERARERLREPLERVACPGGRALAASTSAVRGVDVVLLAAPARRDSPRAPCLVLHVLELDARDDRDRVARRLPRVVAERHRRSASRCTMRAGEHGVDAGRRPARTVDAAPAAQLLADRSVRMRSSSGVDDWLANCGTPMMLDVRRQTCCRGRPARSRTRPSHDASEHDQRAPHDQGSTRHFTTTLDQPALRDDDFDDLLALEVRPNLRRGQRRRLRCPPRSRPPAPSRGRAPCRSPAPESRSLSSRAAASSNAGQPAATRRPCGPAAPTVPRPGAA